jgi:hypothetical protein
MADDVTVDNGGLTDYIVATDDIGSNRQVQLVKPVFGGDGVGTMLALGQGAMSASLPVVIASNQSTVPVSSTFSTTGGTVYSVISAASTNAANVKASAGVLATVAAINNDTTNWAYLKFHNTAGTPTAGSGVVATYGLPPGGGLTLALTTGMTFSTGIGITITGGIATANTTATAASQVAVTLTYH